MSEQDRRTRRTQHLLTQALLDLSAARSYDAISIRDITDRADVGYATFFRHYRSKEALLLDVLGATIDDLLALIEPVAAQGRLEQASARLFTYVAEHRALVQLFLAAQGLPEVQAHMWDLAEQRVFATGTLSATGVAPRDLVVRHLVAASTAMVQWWLERNMPYPPEQMGRIFARLVAAPALETTLPAESGAEDARPR